MSDAPQSSDPAPQSPRKRPYLLFGILAVVAIAAIAVGLPYYRYAQAHESTDDAFLESPVVVISPRVAGHVTGVYVNDNQAVKKGELLAELDARDIQIRIEQAQATLNTILARKKSAQANTDLSKALTTATLQQAEADVEAFSAQAKAADAALAVARSQAEKLAAAAVSAQSETDEAKAKVQGEEAEHTRAAAELKRYQRLDAKIISPLQMDAATAAAQSSEARLTEAQKRLASVEARVTEAQAAHRAGEAAVAQAEAQIAEAKAKFEEARGRLAQAKAGPLQVAYAESQVVVTDAETAQAEAALKQAQLELSYTKIIAPADGHITRKTVETGNYLQTGDAMMMIIPNEIWVVANFRETQLAHMRPGQPAEIHVDAYPHQTFKGHVDSIQSGTGSRFSMLPPENATGNYVKVVQRVPVKIVFDQAPGSGVDLAPGMSVVPEVLIQ